MKKSLFFIAFTLVLMGLNAQSSSEILFNHLVGKWTWLSTSGGIAGVHQTPENTGDVRSLIFTSDSIYIEIENGDTISQRGFSIRKTESLLMNDTTDMVILYSIRRLRPYLSGDTLTLQEDVYDGFCYQYKKWNLTTHDSPFDWIDDTIFYPNPCKDRLFFITKDDSYIQYAILRDLNGKILITTQDGKRAMDVSVLPSGIYIIELYNNGQVLRDKLIKE